MNREETVIAINRLVQAEVNVANEVNSARGVSKKALKEEAAAARALFVAITGSQPTDEEIRAITYM